VAGPNAVANRAYANKILARLKTIRGLADVRMQQPEGAPQLRVDVDRSRMAQLGLTERDVTNSVVASLAGSSQVSPTFWLNPKNGVSYPIVAQVPEYRVSSLSDLGGIPITGAAGSQGGQILGGLGVIKRDSAPAWSAITTSSRCSTSTPPRKAAIWAP
jgi:multidrug efflux pump subunit AcrB